MQGRLKMCCGYFDQRSIHSTKQSVTNRPTLAASNRVLCVLVLSLGACVHTVTTSMETKSPPPGYVAATRSAADCGALLSGPDADKWAKDALGPKNGNVQIPIIREMVLMPHLSTPYNGPAESAKIEMRVAATGLVVKDSVRMTGMTDGPYAKSVLKAARASIFWPAVRAGCAVPAWTRAETGTPFRR